MAKMVKLTDEVGSLLEKWAEKDDTSLAGEIKMLLDMREGKGVADEISKRLDKMAVYLEKKFVDLEAALDGAVLSNSSYASRSSSYSARSNPNNANGVYVPWEVLQPLMFDELYEGKEWLPGAEEAARGSDNLDMCSFFVRDGMIVSDDMWGKTSWLKVSPRVKDYLLSHGVEI